MTKQEEITGTFFYVGKAKGLPGTLASAAALVLLIPFCLFQFERPTTQISYFIFLTLVFYLGLSASAAFVREKGSNDPQEVVIDEVVGVLIVFLLGPITWMKVLAGFLLFRLFDIWKPYPIRSLERLPRGWGVMLDDVLAGIYANLILRFFIH